MSELLVVSALVAGYAGAPVIRGLDLTVRRGGVSALLGANGAGKSTTLRAICNMQLKVSGSILLEGRAIDGLRTEHIARRGVSHVPEGRGTFAEFTVEENLRLGAYTRPAATVKQELARVLEYFPPLASRLRQQAGLLSGGEQQMLAIARALMARPILLLLDEPTFGIAPQVVEEMFQLLRRIGRDDGVGILLVEQNVQLALALADEAYVLENGVVAVSGSAAMLRDDAAVRRAYVGDSVSAGA